MPSRQGMTLNWQLLGPRAHHKVKSISAIRRGHDPKLSALTAGRPIIKSHPSMQPRKGMTPNCPGAVRALFGRSGRSGRGPGGPGGPD
eukprot:2098690-Karenia_brevis.AAC.1